jgi:hypothetical protein
MTHGLIKFHKPPSPLADLHSAGVHELGVAKTSSPRRECQRVAALDWTASNEHSIDRSFQVPPAALLQVTARRCNAAVQSRLESQESDGGSMLDHGCHVFKRPEPGVCAAGAGLAS